MSVIKQLRFKCKFCKHSFNQPNKIVKFKKNQNINNLLRIFQLELTFHKQQYQTNLNNIFIIIDVN